MHKYDKIRFLLYYFHNAWDFNKFVYIYILKSYAALHMVNTTECRFYLKSFN